MILESVGVTLDSVGGHGGVRRVCGESWRNATAKAVSLNGLARLGKLVILIKDIEIPIHQIQSCVS